MSKVISVAQKTFVDLYDSYVLNLSSDVIAVPCDQHGKILTTFEATISFSAKRGTKPVGSKYNKLIDPDTTTNELYHTVTKEAINIIGINDNKIVFKFYQGKIFDDNFKIGIKFSTTDDNAFVFERYITFIKVKNGEKATTFKIYSEQGDTFKEGIENITMKTAAFDGLVEITSGTTYQWAYYDAGVWKNVIENGTSSSLSVTKEKYKHVDYSIFRCTMTYNGNTYDDYFTLKLFNHDYKAIIHFFNDSNTFNTSEQFLVAYVELYKDQQPEEMLKSNKYFVSKKNYIKDDANGTNGATLYTDNTGATSSYENLENGDTMYFIYEDLRANLEGTPKYKAVLRKYNASTKQWDAQSSSSYKYRYINDLYEEDLTAKTKTLTVPNVLVIDKNSISRQREINFTIYQKVKSDTEKYSNDTDLIITRNTASVFDLNDPIVSSTQPVNPKDGQLWLDTSTKPYLLYVYNEEQNDWVYCSEQNGKNIYTSKPSKYYEGDLWVLSSDDMRYFNNVYGDGTMLRAIADFDGSFNKNDWADANASWNELKANMAQYFSFSSSDGVIIKRDAEKFYVQITSDSMDFYAKGKRVVWIGNTSTNIDNMEVEESAKFKCDTVFNQDVQMGKFVWQTEGNGSFSLVYNG